MVRLDHVEQLEDQCRDHTRDDDERDEGAPLPLTEPTDRGDAPADEQHEPEPQHQPAERTRRGERERGTLIAEDAVIHVQLGQPIHHLSRREPAAQHEGPDSDGAAAEEAYQEPAADVATARPRATHQDGHRGERGQRVVLMLEPRE